MVKLLAGERKAIEKMLYTVMPWGHHRLVYFVHFYLFLCFCLELFSKLWGTIQNFLHIVGGITCASGAGAFARWWREHCQPAAQTGICSVQYLWLRTTPGNSSGVRPTSCGLHRSWLLLFNVSETQIDDLLNLPGPR